MIAAALSLFLTMTPAASEASEPSSNRDCSIGPVAKTYGDSDWMVYSCSDGKSVVVVTAEGSPAAPFYFMLLPSTDEVRLYGEGIGTKSATQPAYEELKRLSALDIAALVVETMQTSNARKQEVTADPASEKP